MVEDELLRWILSMTNNGQAPLLISGTPDGIGALTKRLSTLERINTLGYHRFDPIAAPAPVEQKSFGRDFLKILWRYQFVKKKLAYDDAAAELIVELTGGIQRVIIALWVAAHRVAFGRVDDDLRLDDFVTAASTWLAPLGPAIAALRSKDEAKMRRYDDLVKRDTVFWADFWGGVAV